jgi:hypothetical protein
MTPDRQSDFIRSDELQDAAVRVSDLPRLFNVSDRTIRDWIAADAIATFEHPVQTGKGRPAMAIRYGDIPSTEQHPTRWHPR